MIVDVLVGPLWYTPETKDRIGYTLGAFINCLIIFLPRYLKTKIVCNEIYTAD